MKFKNIIDVDFHQAELALLARSNNKSFWIQWHMENYNTPSLNLCYTQKQTMTKKEIDIQIVLGTLPFKEWMKIKGIVQWDNNGCLEWRFPLPEGGGEKWWAKLFSSTSRAAFLDDSYIEHLYNIIGLGHSEWSEEELAKEIIKECYAYITKIDIHNE